MPEPDVIENVVEPVAVERTPPWRSPVVSIPSNQRRRVVFV